MSQCSCPRCVPGLAGLLPADERWNHRQVARGHSISCRSPPRVPENIHCMVNEFGKTIMVVMQLIWVWHVVSAVNVRDRACGHEAQQESVKQEEGLQGLCLMSARFACLQSCDGTARVFTGRCNPCICTAKAAVSCRSRSSRHVIASLSVNLVVQATQTAYTHTHTPTQTNNTNNQSNK